MTELLFQTDSYIREFEAVVTRIDKDNHGVILDRTAFFPGGGGQPADRGWLHFGESQAGGKARSQGPRGSAPPGRTRKRTPSGWQYSARITGLGYALSADANPYRDAYSMRRDLARLRRFRYGWKYGTP